MMASTTPPKKPATAQHSVLDQRHPVIAEIHVVAADEDGRGPEAAAVDGFLRVGAQGVLDRLLIDGGK